MQAERRVDQAHERQDSVPVLGANDTVGWHHGTGDVGRRVILMQGLIVHSWDWVLVSKPDRRGNMRTVWERWPVEYTEVPYEPQEPEEVEEWNMIPFGGERIVW